MSEIVIRAENLGKKYRITHQRERRRSDSLRDALTDGLLAPKRWLESRASNGNARGSLNSGAVGRPKNEEFWALKDVSFEVKQGEAVGVIGRNGAGKSTLLKLLCRITEPTEGKARIRG